MSCTKILQVRKRSNFENTVCAVQVLPEDAEQDQLECNLPGVCPGSVIIPPNDMMAGDASHEILQTQACPRPTDDSNLVIRALKRGYASRCSILQYDLLQFVAVGTQAVSRKEWSSTLFQCEAGEGDPGAGR